MVRCTCRKIAAIFQPSHCHIKRRYTSTSAQASNARERVYCACLLHLLVLLVEHSTTRLHDVCESAKRLHTIRLIRTNHILVVLVTQWTLVDMMVRASKSSTAHLSDISLAQFASTLTRYENWHIRVKGALCRMRLCVYDNLQVDVDRVEDFCTRVALI